MRLSFQPIVLLVQSTLLIGIVTIKFANGFSTVSSSSQQLSRTMRIMSRETYFRTKRPSFLSLSQSSSTNTEQSISESVSNLKKVLEREYTTFFNPMYTEWYAPNVSFEDPMTSISGVESYRNNVDMLAGRTIFGKILFDDAGIVLHSIMGGDISDDGQTISDITTRWTLRLTASILPWKPTARFTGISVYNVTPSSSKNSKEAVEIIGQTDYWDSINIRPGSSGQYGKVDKFIAIQDFIDQMKPGGFQAKAAAPELPYQLLRRGNGYEIRAYPAFAAVKMPYNRRDEGFGSMGSFTRGMNPLSPAIMEVQNSDLADKYMFWPVSYAPPGESSPPPLSQDLIEKAGTGQWRTTSISTIDSKIVAVREFDDASMEPVVRKADRELREFLKRDGLVASSESEDLVKFAQFDAVYSMGKRRGEVWIDLKERGHPW